MRRVLVTGGGGFIGQNALPYLLARGFEVHATTRRSGAPNSTEGVTWHEADLLCADQVASLLSHIRPSHVLHLAWDTRPGEYWNSLENLRWLRASLDLIQQFAEVGGTRVVVAGSCAEYGWTDGLYAEDETPCKPSSLYGASKLSQEIMVGALAERFGFSWACGRVFFLYGPGEHPLRLVPTVVQAFASGNAPVLSSGLQVRDYLHVRDVGSAFAAVLDSAVSGPVNIGSGVPVTVRDLVLRIAEHFGKTDAVEFGSMPPRLNDPARVVAMVEKLSREVGWKPDFGLDEGVADTIHAFRKIG